MLRREKNFFLKKQKKPSSFIPSSSVKNLSLFLKKKKNKSEQINVVFIFLKKKKKKIPLFYQ